ncbi:MAG TPA: type II toxin-antitoxin system HicB family antitoxin [Armatimonadota bacterium]|nr:type II toxin-antitoxin system HicB family antitoxin [Armatimonadota bacterium]
MKLHVAIRPDEIDGGYIAACPEIPGCMSEGLTEQDALENLREAIELCLEARKEQGLPLTVPLRELEVAAS